MARDTLFKSYQSMPDGMGDGIDDPVRTTQTPSDAKAGAQSLSKEGTDRMNVKNCCRPRRGHDY